MIYEIPVLPGTAPDYTQQIDLDGTAYLFRFLWSERAQRWALTVTQDGEPIITNRPLVVGIDLFDRTQTTRPRYALVLLSLRGGPLDNVGRYELGTAYKLYYTDGAV